jgi:hypothetical protein
MAYTARQLITRAFFLSGIVGREVQTVSGAQLSVGLDLLNSLLAVKGGNSSLIPYYKQYTFNAIIGQEKYFIPQLIIPSTLTFNIGSVRYSSTPMDRDFYFGAPKSENIASLPFSCHFERCLNGCNIYLTFTPADTYPMKIWGKFSFDTLTDDENTDLELTYEPGYLEYLRFALAESVCFDYSIAFSDYSERKLRELEKQWRNVSPPDLVTQKLSTFQPKSITNYGNVNLGRGWTTP